MIRISLSRHRSCSAASRAATVIAGFTFLVTAPVTVLADKATTSLYDGEAVAAASSKIGPWGGGTVSDTDQANYTDGKRSLVITTNGPYQGALFELTPPTTIGDVKTDKSYYIAIALTQSPSGPPQPMTMPKPKPKGGFPDQIGSAFPRSFLHLAQNMPGQMPGQMGPPQGQMPGQNGQDMNQNPGQPTTPAGPPPPPPLNFIRVVITTDSGATAECIRAVSQPLGTSAWSNISFPLSLFNLPAADATKLKLKSVMIAGDIPARFYLGYAHVVADSQPIAASILGDADVAPGAVANWSFLINPGASNVKWDWKVDDGTPDQPGVQTVQHTFAKTGVYHVSLTVTDVDGIKPPVTATMKIVVEDQ